MNLITVFVAGVEILFKYQVSALGLYLGELQSTDLWSPFCLRFVVGETE